MDSAVNCFKLLLDIMLLHLQALDVLLNVLQFRVQVWPREPFHANAAECYNQEKCGSRHL